MSYSGSETHVSDLGNQYNNGPHRDQIFDSLSALCLALWAKNRHRFLEEGVGGGGGETDATKRLFRKGVRLSLSPSLSLSLSVIMLILYIYYV